MKMCPCPVGSRRIKFASRVAVAKLRLDGAPTPRSLGVSDDEAARHQSVRAGAPLNEGSASGASDRRGRRIVASSEQDKRLRAELA